MAMVIMAVGPAFGHPSRRRSPQIPHSHPALNKTDAQARKVMRPTSANDAAKERHFAGELLNVRGPCLPGWPHTVSQSHWTIVGPMLVPAFSHALVIVHSGPANERLR